MEFRGVEEKILSFLSPWMFEGKLKTSFSMFILTPFDYHCFVFFLALFVASHIYNLGIR